VSVPLAGLISLLAVVGRDVAVTAVCRTGPGGGSRPLP
jgi:hypothetical protein